MLDGTSSAKDTGKVGIHHITAHRKCREQCRSHPAMTRNTDHRAVQRITVGIGVATVSSDTVATELGLRLRQAELLQSAKLLCSFRDNDKHCPDKHNNDADH